MKCHICDRDLSDKETIYNEDLQAYEPCTTCLDIALDAAYCNGFSIEHDEIPTLDADFDTRVEYTEFPLSGGLYEPYE